MFLSFFIIIFLSFLVKKAASCVFEQVGNIFPLTFLIPIHNIFFGFFFLKKTLTFRIYPTTSCFLRIVQKLNLPVEIAFSFIFVIKKR